MIWAMVVKGGPVMIPILLGSVVGLAIVLERIIALWRFSEEDGQTCLTRALHEMRQGRVAEALAATRGVEHPVGAVLRRGLEQWGLPLPAMERAMEQALHAQVRVLERWFGGLATLITLEPMLGFLGTITGLIRAFMAWEAAGTKVTVSLLAGGIYEAMITTAAGLIIAIPLLAVYNAFVSRIRRLTGQATDAANELLELYARLQPHDRPHETPSHARVSSHA